MRLQRNVSETIYKEGGYESISLIYLHRAIASGVPHGSGLGALRFIRYTGGLFHWVLSSCLSGYADDTNVLYFFDTFNIASAKANVNRDLLKIDEFSKEQSKKIVN